MKTDAIYGDQPINFGLIDFEPMEMLFWLYCPIKLPGGELTLPKNLLRFMPFVEKVWWGEGPKALADKYIYLTAKTLWVTPENPGNRPDWHSDGFLTDDLNFIWSDRAPTVFFSDGIGHAFNSDHEASLTEMEALCEPRSDCHFTFPDRHLLRLDQTVLHKTPSHFEPGMRTFVKVSVSSEKYALIGNSINWELGPIGDYYERGSERNCPQGDHP